MIIDQYMSYVSMQYSSAIYFSKAKLERQIEKFGNEKMTVEKKKMAMDKRHDFKTLCIT